MEVLNSIKTKLGNTIELIGEPSENNILIVGVVHGDEPQGKYLIDKYIEKYSVNSTTSCMYSFTSESLIPRRCTDKIGDKSLLFIPCLNPDGMQLNIRTNANNVDINRNFPTQNWGQNKGDNATCDDENSNYFGGKSPASEIETQFLIDTIEKYSPSLIVTLHTPYKIVNYDGPAKEIAQMISDIIKYPVEESVGYPTPGSFGTWAGVERNFATITLEMDEKVPVAELQEPVHKIFDKLKF